MIENENKLRKRGYTMIKKKAQHLENGSVSVYTIAIVLSFLLILGGIFAISNAIRKDQLKSLVKIKEIYAQKIDSSAMRVAAAPELYYGKTITGYTGYGKESSGYNWQIYHSDGKNIYIITTDYILASDCPNGKNR